jgi:cysteine synthase
MALKHLVKSLHSTYPCPSNGPFQRCFHMVCKKPKSRSLNVFSGPSAVRDFLDPERNLPLPLVELPSPITPFQNEKIRIFAKIMYLTPLFNIKSLASLSLLLGAQASGKLTNVHTIVENSSGNKVFADAILARMFGIKNVIAIVPMDIAPGKIEILRLFGVTPEHRDESIGQPSGISAAREMGTRPGFFNPGQYENDDNPAAYEKWLAPELWEQTDGKIGVFCAGLGTTGTIVGASRRFRRTSKRIAIVGVACLPGETVPGVRSVSRLKEIRFNWRGAIDYLVEVGARESFAKSLQLCRAGVMAGPSSGFALAGLLKFIEAQRISGTLDQFRNSQGEVIAVFVCPDSALLYLEKYSEHLA